MNTANELSTKQSTVTPTQPLNFVAQQHSFVMFYIVCLQTEDSDAMRRAVAKLICTYDRMNPEFANSQYFADLLLFARNRIIENDGNEVYGDINRIYEHMNENRLVNVNDNGIESSYNEENSDDIDKAMEAMIEDLRVMQMNF